MVPLPLLLHAWFLQPHWQIPLPNASSTAPTGSSSSQGRLVAQLTKFPNGELLALLSHQWWHPTRRVSMMVVMPLTFTSLILLISGAMLLTGAFWIQYHNGDDLSGPCSSSDKHLICPSDTSTAYAKCNKLLPFHRFLNLTHTDTYIHGPFNIATINGRKSRDWTG